MCIFKSLIRFEHNLSIYNKSNYMAAVLFPLTPGVKKVLDQATEYSGKRSL